MFVNQIFKKFVFAALLLVSIPIFSKLSEVHAEPPPIYVIKIMTNNDCYKYGREFIPEGIMVHSTATPGVMAHEWYRLWDKSYKDGVGFQKGREICVHFFLDNGVICQYLPIRQRAWHCGRGKLGSGNDTHFSIECCELDTMEYNPGRTRVWSYDPCDPKNQKYFNDMWQNLLWLCVKLCHCFQINPGKIISHKEGHALGIASNHGDPEHWWEFHLRDMDTLRTEVFDELMGKICETVLQDVQNRVLLTHDIEEIPKPCKLTSYHKNMKCGLNFIFLPIEK